MRLYGTLLFLFPIFHFPSQSQSLDKIFLDLYRINELDTWNTVRRALVIVSKFDVGRPSGKLKLPPKSCIPNKANIKINRNNKRRSERMDDMAFVKATTRFRSEDQYL